MAKNREQRPDLYNVIRDEFNAFWDAGLHPYEYIDHSAIVVQIDLDDEKVTLTRVFYKGPDTYTHYTRSKERAEDVMIDWFTEEQQIQCADSVDISVYMNYSPLRLTVDGLISVLDGLKETGKQVRMSLKFVELYNLGEGETDCEENREGLRILNHYGIRVEVVKGRDWQFLLQTLTRKSAKKRQNSCNNIARKRLEAILMQSKDQMTNVESYELLARSPGSSSSNEPASSPHDNSSSSHDKEEGGEKESGGGKREQGEGDREVDAVKFDADDEI